MNRTCEICGATYRIPAARSARWTKCHLACRECVQWQNGQVEGQLTLAPMRAYAEAVGR